MNVICNAFRFLWAICHIVDRIHYAFMTEFNKKLANHILNT